MRGVVGTCRAGPGGPKKAQEIVPHTIVLSCHHTGITGQLPYSALQCQGNANISPDEARRGVEQN